MSPRTSNASTGSVGQIASSNGSLTRKVYEPPAVVEWGSVEELTRGGLNENQDGDGSGTAGV